MALKNNEAPLKTMSEEIREIYKSNPSMSPALIEIYLEEKLHGHPADEKLSFVEKLAQEFQGSTGQPQGAAPARGGIAALSEQKEYSHLFTLLFGKNISKFDLSSEEHLEKLAKSLNTIFDSLNQIIGVIHTTLLGEQSELQTIRHIIGSDIESMSKTDSLHNYLDQIQRAFLVAHKAYQQAAKNKISQMLGELSPDKISSDTNGGLKFGPLRKAEMFEVYKEKHQSCKGWLESGRLNEELLREFEKICQKLYYSFDKKG